MEYCIEQERENTRFVIKASWKEKINRIQFLKIIVNVLMMVTAYIFFFLDRRSYGIMLLHR